MKAKHNIRLAVLAVIVVSGVFTIGESLWWNTAKSTYPRSLVDAAPAGANDSLSLAQACGEPVEVASDGPDKALVRCMSFWPFRSVWSVPRANVAPLLQ